MGKVTISTLDKMKAAGEKFVCITAYDATFARLVSEAGAETILVGDSLGMVLQGHDSTIPVTLRAHGLPHGVRVPGRPEFPGHRRHALHELHHPGPGHGKCHPADAERRPDGQDGGRHLAERTASACWWNAVSRSARTWALPPSPSTQFGGFKVQGRTPKEAKSILADAVEIQDAGASLLVLECIPAPLAADISRKAGHPGHRYRRRCGHRRPGAGAARPAGPVGPHRPLRGAISWTGQDTIQARPAGLRRGGQVRRLPRAGAHLQPELQDMNYRAIIYIICKKTTHFFVHLALHL